MERLWRLGSVGKVKERLGQMVDFDFILTCFFLILMLSPRDLFFSILILIWILSFIGLD